MEKEMSDYIKYEVRVYKNGDKFWYKEGKWHREDGPACEYADGAKYWFKEGKCHREDGPAGEYSNGSKFWYLNGLNYSEAEFNKEIAKKSKGSCEGKIVEIDGKKYTLTSVIE